MIGFMAGLFYVVATPIGNLEDISLRALRILKEVDVIFSEDTRETSKVLQKFSIEKAQVSYRDQIHNRMLPVAEEYLNSGRSIALITDCGTPLISDPGFKLVSELRQKGFTVLGIPGPSAVITALSISGLPTDKFTFVGFLPRGSGQRKDLLLKYGELDATLALYESPYRVVSLLDQILTYLGDRYVCVANELTKVHENVKTGAVSEILAWYKSAKPRGEFVVLIAKSDFNGSKDPTRRNNKFK